MKKAIEGKLIFNKIFAGIFTGLIGGFLLVGVVPLTVSEDTTLFEEDFSNPNMVNWIPFGSPSPRVLVSVEGRNGVFDNNGDGWCDSDDVDKLHGDDGLMLTYGHLADMDDTGIQISQSRDFNPTNNATWGNLMRIPISCIVRISPIRFGRGVTVDQLRKGLS